MLKTLWLLFQWLFSQLLLCLKPLPVAYKVPCDINLGLPDFPQTYHSDALFSLCSSHTMLVIFHKYANHLCTSRMLTLLFSLSRMLFSYIFTQHVSNFGGHCSNATSSQRTFLIAIKKNPVVDMDNSVVIAGERAV